MGDGFSRRTGTDLDRLRVFQDLYGQGSNLLRHGGREEESLSLGWHVVQYSLNVGQESHVTHCVCFVQHQYLNVGEVNVLVANVVQQPSGAGDNNLRAAPNLGDLRTFGNATVNGDGFYAEVFAQ